MDWRFYAVVASAVGSLGLATVGAYAAITSGPNLPKKIGSVPALASPHRLIVPAPASGPGLQPSADFTSSTPASPSVVVIAADLPQSAIGSGLPGPNGGPEYSQSMSPRGHDGGIAAADPVARALPEAATRTGTESKRSSGLAPVANSRHDGGMPAHPQRFALVIGVGF